MSSLVSLSEKLKIVVARYNENIGWLAPIMKSCIICNKGEPLNVSNEVMYENVGRESDTYLRYIIENYDSLPETVVFTQANIADHKGSNNPNYLLSIGINAYFNSKSNNYYTHHDVGKCYCFDRNWNIREEGKYYLHDNYKNNTPVLFGDWFCKNIQETYPDPIHIYCNAIFAVKKELILKHDVEYYRKLLGEVNHHINPAEGHFMERSWFYIFQ